MGIWRGGGWNAVLSGRYICHPPSAVPPYVLGLTHPPRPAPLAPSVLTSDDGGGFQYTNPAQLVSLETAFRMMEWRESRFVLRIYTSESITLHQRFCDVTIVDIPEFGSIYGAMFTRSGARGQGNTTAGFHWGRPNFCRWGGKAQIFKYSGNDNRRKTGQCSSRSNFRHLYGPICLCHNPSCDHYFLIQFPASTELRKTRSSPKPHPASWKRV